MSHLSVGNWLIDQANWVPNPGDDGCSPFLSGYGFFFYILSAIYFRIVNLAGATPDDFNIDEEDW